MRLVVFGQTGQVARELARRAPGATFLDRAAADFSNPDRIAEVARSVPADVFVNAAAYTAVDRAESEEELATVVNGLSVGALAEAAAGRGLPVVHISTDYVFDGAGEAARRPDEPTAPLGAYGRSKLVGEERLRAAGGPYAILRTSWVFSAHGQNFVKTMLRLAETRDRLTVVADQVGGPTAAGDIAGACIAMARALRERPDLTGTYHYSGAPDTSWAGFARDIFARAGRKVEVEDIPTKAYPTPARRPLNSRLDCTETEAAFGLGRPDWRAALDGVLGELGATA